MGVYRRRLSEGRRTHRTVIKHTDEEWARVQSLAQAQGISVPRLYERSLHAGDVVAAARLSRFIGELGIVLRVMSKTSVNLNQLARVANSTAEVAAPQVLAAARHFDAQVERVTAMMRAVSHGDLFVEVADSASAGGAGGGVASPGCES